MSFYTSVKTTFLMRIGANYISQNLQLWSNLFANVLLSLGERKNLVAVSKRIKNIV